MIFRGRSITVARLYRLTAIIGLAGTVLYFAYGGFRPALAFALGSATSLLNLWLFNRLATGIAPTESSKKPWQAGAFAGRYLVFFAAGYVIVKALDVSPLPVVFGLFASTAAVLLSSVLELFGSFSGRNHP
ncbi:MAG: ATP synthase subunit I [Bryobacteraceae bacterium]